VSTDAGNRPAHAPPDVVDTLRLVADGAPRIEPALRLAALREHSLLALADLIQNLSASPDAFHLADLALFNLMGQFGAPRAALWLYSGNNGAPVLIRAHGVGRSMARAIGLAEALRADE